MPNKKARVGGLIFFFLVEVDRLWRRRDRISDGGLQRSATDAARSSANDSGECFDRRPVCRGPRINPSVTRGANYRDREFHDRLRNAISRCIAGRLLIIRPRWL